MYKIVQIIEKRVICLVRKNHIWTKENIVQSPFKNVDIPDITIPEYMWRNLDKWSNKTAVVCGFTDRQYTYSQLYQQSKIFGASLRKKFMIEDGDIIAVMLPNIPDYPIVAFGILAAGGVITTFNHLLTPYEIQTLVSLSNAKIIITLPENQLVIKEALKLAKKNIPIIAVDIEQCRLRDTISYKELINDSIDVSVLKDVKRKSSDVAGLLYSSGTTGLPKGVELTHRNIISNSEQQSTECRRHEDTTDSHQDTALGILPFSHISGIGINMFHKLSVGVKLVVVRKFHPDTFPNVLAKYDFNIFTLSPPTAQYLGTYPRVSSKHLQHLRYAGVGGAPLPKADVERLLDKCKNNVHVGQIYGLTETSPVVTLGGYGFKKTTSVGVAVPNVLLRVVDSEMNNLGPNEKDDAEVFCDRLLGYYHPVYFFRDTALMCFGKKPFSVIEGELLIKGPNVMKGYKDNYEANKITFVDNDWLRSGDLVSIDKEGAVYIADRLRDLIKVNAYQVPPAELENIIKDIPKVVDVAVVGIEDSRTGQRPKAFIVSNDKNITEKEIMNYVNQRVASYKQIKQISFVDHIPKNASGKIMKRVLIEQYCK